MVIAISYVFAPLATGIEETINAKASSAYEELLIPAK